MKNRYIISLLLLLPSFICANEYHISESYKNNAFTAVLQSNVNFETSTNPIPVSILFSEEVMEFDESYILTSNTHVVSLVRKSGFLYEMNLVPQTTGPLTITLSKYTTSVHGEVLQGPPSISFYYYGASIISKELTKVTSTEARIVVTTSKPSQLFALLVSSSASEPTYHDIVTHGKSLTEVDKLNTYAVDFSQLSPSTVYRVYISGREKSGTMIESSVDEIFTTLNADGSAFTNKSICPVGWMMNMKGELEKSACSGHGTCVSGKCVCDSDYIGTNCAAVKEMTVDSATDDTWLLHSDWQLTGMAEEDEDLMVYFQTSVRQQLAEKLSISITAVQIREWTVFHTQLSQLFKPQGRSRGYSQSPKRRMQETDSFLLHVHVSCVVPSGKGNEKMEQLNSLSLTSNHFDSNSLKTTSVRLMRTALQTTADSWKCFDGKKEADESDVDCGGACSVKCGEGLACQSKDDCKSDLRCRNNMCSAFDPATLVLSLAIIGLVIGIMAVLIAIYFMTQFNKTKQEHFQRMNSGKTRLNV